MARICLFTHETTSNKGTGEIYSRAAAPCRLCYDPTPCAPQEHLCRWTLKSSPGNSSSPSAMTRISSQHRPWVNTNLSNFLRKKMLNFSVFLSLTFLHDSEIVSAPTLGRNSEKPSEKSCGSDFIAQGDCQYVVTLQHREIVGDCLSALFLFFFTHTQKKKQSPTILIAWTPRFFGSPKIAKPWGRILLSQRTRTFVL